MKKRKGIKIASVCNKCGKPQPKNEKQHTTAGPHCQYQNKEPPDKTKNRMTKQEQ